MKSISETKYYVYNNKIVSDVKILSISDIHFSSKFNDEKINLLIRYIDNVNPDYILIPGDLIDSIDEMQDIKQFRRLIDFLNKINKRKILISMGNHDYYYNYLEDSELCTKKNKEFYKNINSLKNIYVLDDDIYMDNIIYVNGISLKLDYYHYVNNKNKKVEDKEYLVNYLDKHIRLLDNLNKINISLIHSPTYIRDKDVEKYFKKMDIINCGHMHNGCVIPFIDKIWKSDRGFVSPSMSLFPHNVRNTLNKKDDKLLVNGAISTFHKRSNLTFLNIFYPLYSSIIIFTNNKKYNNDLIIKEKRTFK